MIRWRETENARETETTERQRQIQRGERPVGPSHEGVELGSLLSVALLVVRTLQAGRAIVAAAARRVALGARRLSVVAGIEHHPLPCRLATVSSSVS